MKIEVFAVCLTLDETVDSEDNIKKVKERLRNLMTSQLPLSVNTVSLIRYHTSVYCCGGGDINI